MKGEEDNVYYLLREELNLARTVNRGLSWTLALSLTIQVITWLLLLLSRT